VGQKTPHLPILFYEEKCMMHRRSFLRVASLAALLFSFSGIAFAAPANHHYTLAVSNYSGWLPWYYAADSGILQKWADKYHVQIDVKPMPYMDSVEAYANGQADAVVMTNMEALDIPAARGVDSSVVVMGDYSNGNDAILTKRLTLADLKGTDVLLSKGSVSQYLLSRGLQKAGIDEKQVNLVDESDTKIAKTFMDNTQQKVVVTWNPMVMQIQKNIGIKKVFDSASIPGEIQDLLVVNTQTLNADPDFARALTGAWYEVMDIMSQQGKVSDEAISKMADLGHVPVAEFKGQLRTTAFYSAAQSAVDYTKSTELKAKMNLVRNFCFTNGLLGANATSVDSIGIQYPDGTIHGEANNVKLRYNSTFMEESAQGKLK
jgi:NitT/TauT family transport system substrate-binding protein